MPADRNLQITSEFPLVYDALGVARALGLTFEQQFLNRRRRLGKHGFPRPLPMTPLRWSRQLVEEWVVRQTGEPPRAPAAPAPKRNPIVVALENHGRAA